MIVGSSRLSQSTQIIETLSTRTGDTRTAYRKSIIWFSHAQNERSCLQSPVVLTSTTPFPLFHVVQATSLPMPNFFVLCLDLQIFRRNRKESSFWCSVLKYFRRHFKINVVPEAEESLKLK